MIETRPIDATKLDALNIDELRTLASQLLVRVDKSAREITWRDAKIEKLTFEVAQLRRLRYGVKSEQLDAQQKALFEEATDEDLADLEAQLQALRTPPKADDGKKDKPKRAPLPAHFPRREHHHEPENTTCACGCQMKRIGEDVSEKLDYAPGDFTVDRHIRGKWACAECQTLIQAPVPAEVIDKGIPTSGLLAHVLVAKYQDHLPLYRQEAIFGRAGLAIPRSTLASWVGVCGAQLQPLVDALKAHILARPVLHADETPVAMLDPGKGKTHRAYLWAYASGAFEPLKAVVYDFQPSRSGEHARNFLGPWQGSLVCDDFSGYKALFEKGVIEIGCMAHARRKFVELLKANKSPIAETALGFIGGLYGIEREVKDLKPDDRLTERRRRSKPVADAWHEWMLGQRSRATDGTALAKALDYSLNRWDALVRYLDDPALPIDNNHDERQIRPWATGRKNWLFAGTLLAGQRAAAIMSLIQSAKLNGHDPYVYLKDVLTRLPTQKSRNIDELLPHLWTSAA
jgi:transposase